ncbi:hypothetical protein JCM8097_004374 [Rhodosporidiobolus ruineniae]
MSTTPPLHKRLPHSRHASRERDAGPAESILTFESTSALAGAPIYAAPGQEPAVKRAAHRKLAILGTILLFFFFLNALWLWGSFYQLPRKVHNLDIAIVDFDGGSIGSALTTAAQAFDGPSNVPNFHIISGGSTSVADIIGKVKNGEYWAAIYANTGASDRFTSAIASESAASGYNASQALTYTGLEVRYNTVWQKYVYPSVLNVLDNTKTTFAGSAVAPLLSSSTSYGSKAAAVLANPISATYVNQTPFAFGTRSLLNTAGFIFPILLIAFFLSAANTTFHALGYFQNLSYRSHLRTKVLLGLLWPFLASLVTACWYLMFDEDYVIGAKYFFALWALLWVYCIIYFNLLDALYALSPASAIPLIVFTLLVLSVSSTSHPLELQPAFFKLQYAFPSHATWDIMITIFGHGAVRTLKYDLPILAGWLIATGAVQHLALKKREKDGLTAVVGAAVVPVAVKA